MKKNILIIDDSALIRRVLSDIINADDRFQVANIVHNGLEAFDLLVTGNKYDGILLDINMPKMNGLELLEQLNKHNIKATIIVVSTIAKEGAKETIRALELGAFDFVTKPDSYMDAKSRQFHEQIIDSLACATGLMEFATVSDVHEVTSSKRQRPITPIIQRQEPQKLIGQERPFRAETMKGQKLIALACSTGGPKALQEIVPKLPADLDAPMLIVQHMPEGFTNSLAQRLDEMSHIHVKEAEDGEIIKKGVVYIAKGGRQMRLNKQSDGNYKLSVTQEAARGGLKPCADIMYESLMSSDFEEITCVVLTGMGGDGTRGIKQLQEHNNIYVIAQNEETCTVYGMPRMVADAGLVNEVVPLDSVSSAIVKNVGVRYDGCKPIFGDFY